MKLYLVRHGSYSSQHIDASCPLSAEGKSEISRLATHLKKTELPVSQIFHSSKLRAKQTAKLIADAINEGQCDYIEGLEPNDPIQPMLKMIHTNTEDLMLVGHLPFMAKLTNQLLNLDEEAITIDYQPGTTVCLSNDNGPWAVDWILSSFLY